MVIRFYVPVDGFTKAAKLEKLKPVEGTKDAAFHGKITANGKSTDRVVIFDDKAGALAGLVKVEFKELGMSSLLAHYAWDHIPQSQP